ncbi:response regulator transcription factor [Leuconostoc lactis]|uniref:response regulator transcription factor n=1 Tax=Leuconostoc lactis TaxID=1246 RepID=UPI0021A4B206|nr:response regulator transcription factor [Leuconostoc lactis]MCT3115233.1 DNA-binding response regulator [Leuconostoc lactis]
MATVLIIEDEMSLQFYLKNELTFEGYTVLQAFDGQQGLALLASETVDAVLLDWMLPKKSGMAVLRHVRQTNQTLPVVLRRQVAPVQTTFEVADLTLNTTTHRVQRGDQLIALTQREFDLLAFLMQHEGQVVSRDAILDHVWGIDFAGQYNTVDVNIRHLRQKIARDGQPSLIETARGLGYVMRVGD